MKVLWFTNTASCYKSSFASIHAYNGGGWISSLQKELEKRGLELGICFFAQNLDKNTKSLQNGTVYYPIKKPSKGVGYLIKQLFYTKQKASELHEKITIPTLLDVIQDFKPDVIHVFGTENIFGLVGKYTEIPLIIHLQGILTAALNAYLPPSISWTDYLFSSWRIKEVLERFSEMAVWKRNSISEQRIFKSVNYVMGRTEWDKHVANVMNPKIKYYYCGEMLRDIFYDTTHSKHLPEIPTYVTIISSQLYKGFDLILKTAYILKNILKMDFIWKVYGDTNDALAKKMTRINPESVNVRLMGVAKSDELKSALLNSTVYIHTSYIENSPNAICEAAISGCAIVATNVGGVSSLIKDGETGFLVSANDPYNMAYHINYLTYNPKINIMIGSNAQKEAIVRHDKESIVNRIMHIYNDIQK